MRLTKEMTEAGWPEKQHFRKEREGKAQTCVGGQDDSAQWDTVKACTS